MKQEDTIYRERLIKFGYSEEDINTALEFRDSCQHMTFEQFTQLHLSGVIKRMVKLKQKRNIYLDESGDLFYLNDYNKKYEQCGKWNNIENG